MERLHTCYSRHYCRIRFFFRCSRLSPANFLYVDVMLHLLRPNLQSGGVVSLLVEEVVTQ